MIDVYPRYAELLARRGGTLPTAADRARPPRAVHARRPARPAGLAQARLDRSVLPRRRRAGPRAGRKGRGFTEEDKAVLRDGRARAAEQGHSGIPRRRRRAARSSSRPRRSTTRSCRCCATRDIYLRTHPDSRMPRQPLRHPEDAAEQLERAVGLPRAAVRPPAGRALAVGRVGVRRDGAAGRRGRLHVDGDRRADPGAHARHHVRARRPAARSSSPSGSTRRTASDAGGAQRRVRVPRSRAVGSDRLHLRRLGRRRGGRRLRRAAGRGRAAATPSAPAGERRSSRSSWTARTPGSTSRAAAGRSSGRSTGRLSAHPELRTVTMAEACAEPRQRAGRHLSRLVDRRQLLHLDRPRRRPARLEPAGRRPRRARRARRGVDAGRRSRGRARKC